jgi:hypothetical protein
MSDRDQRKADAIEEWFKEATNRADRQWYRWAEGTHEPIYKRGSNTHE